MKNAALRWLWTVPGKKKLHILVLTLAQTLHGASGVLYALLLRGLVDAAAGKDGAGFWRYLALLVLLVCVQLALRAVVRWLTELSKSALENAFKERLVGVLLRRELLRVGAVHTGEWLNRLTNDAKLVADGWADILPGLAGMAVKLVSALAMIIALEPGFAAILIPLGALLALFTWIFRRKLKALHKTIQEADGRLRVFLQERIGSLLLIRSFAAERRTEDETAALARAHQAARLRRNRFSNLANVGFGAAMSGMYLLGVGWCGYGILMGTVSFGTLTAVAQLITQIQAPFANITGYLPRWYAMLASAERLMEAERFPADDAVAKPLNEIRDFYDRELCSVGLDQAAFAYDPADWRAEGLAKDGAAAVLENFSIEIRKGEYVAFTGRSGCGKSTALKLLMCVYAPDRGMLYYSDNDRRKKPLTAEYRRLFAYVPQGSWLMSGTIREIVSFAAPDEARDEEKLAEALRIACAEAFVSELDSGVDTLLGERGAGLSEGQLQRLAIARAVFSGSPILLLDEATSALDAATEAQLLRNLRSMTDKTVVIVTHRSAVLSICDRVIAIGESGGDSP